MSIQNELSSEIAVALLARAHKEPEKMKHVKELVLKVHSIFQEITVHAHEHRVRAAAAAVGKIERQKS